MLSKAEKKDFVGLKNGKPRFVIHLFCEPAR